jgi:hypothetical protein
VTSGSFDGVDDIKVLVVCIIVLEDGFGFVVFRVRIRILLAPFLGLGRIKDTRRVALER